MMLDGVGILCFNELMVVLAADGVIAPSFAPLLSVVELECMRSRTALLRGDAAMALEVLVIVVVAGVVIMVRLLPVVAFEVVSTLVFAAGVLFTTCLFKATGGLAVGRT